MIKRIDVIKHIQDNRVMYLGRDTIEPDLLAGFLVSDATTLGAKSVTINVLQDYWVVLADKDWIHSGHTEASTLELFRKIVALENGGQNALRRESVLYAFSEKIAVVDSKGDVTNIKQVVPENVIDEVSEALELHGYKLAVVFKVDS